LLQNRHLRLPDRKRTVSLLPRKVLVCRAFGLIYFDELFFNSPTTSLKADFLDKAVSK
jgi:hypothetical protein